MGRLLAKNKNAYAYLSESAAKFPFGKQMAQILSQEIGFTSVNYKPQTFGSCYHIYFGQIRLMKKIIYLIFLFPFLGKAQPIINLEDFDYQKFQWGLLLWD